MKYSVSGVITTHVHAILEADSMDEAFKIARDMSGADYDEEGTTENKGLTLTHIALYGERDQSDET